MRQLFFAIVLVAAAFGGGAMVNGPGFRWAQDHFFNYMGLKDGGEIATIDLPPAPAEADGLDAAVPPKPPAAPAARKPEVGPSQPAAVDPTVQLAASPQPEPASPVTESTPPPLLAGPSGAPGPAPAAPPAPLDPGVTPALLAAFSPASKPGGGLPPAEPPASASASTTTTTTTSAGGGWAELRDRLRAQGVSHYTIETDLAGRVVFSCLIPLAGKQAVSQRFEAEGDDEFSAADAALRRIKLWRATQAPAPAPATR